jgi:GH25 family lysozyme M1 (1,4-beta-N-acetylmuramidase)
LVEPLSSDGIIEESYSLNYKMKFLIASVAVLSATSSAQSFGVDVSEPVSNSAATCMIQKNNKTFSVTRCWESLNHFDANCPATLAAFEQAKIQADIYMFPCSFASATDQLNELQGNITASKSVFNFMWFDVETNPLQRCAWSTSNLTANCDYMNELIQAALSNPFFSNRTGIYTSVHEWSMLMGTSCTVGADAGLPLWYPHYESPPNPSFSDFKPFSGWTTPFMKQYADGPATCGVGTDLNWRP